MLMAKAKTRAKLMEKSKGIRGLNVVVVNNVSGMRITMQGKKILSLRDVIGDQEFEFKTTVLAQKFTDAINNRGDKGLSALFAGEEINTDEAGGDEAGGDEAGGDQAGGDNWDTAREEMLKNKTVKELKSICKDLGVSGYSKLNEGELIACIIAHEDEEAE
jgi:hypothetical protein